MEARPASAPIQAGTVKPLPKESNGSAHFSVTLSDGTVFKLPPRPDPLTPTTNRNRASDSIVVFPIKSGLGTSAQNAMQGPYQFIKSGIVEFLQAQVGFGSVERAESITEQDFCGPDTKDLSPSDKLFRQIAPFAAEGAERMLSYLNQGKTVLSIGGDHSMSFASLKAFSNFCHDNNLKGAVVHIDAHGDINYLRPENNYQPDAGESGNPHGMVLRAAFDKVHPLIDTIYPEAYLDWKNYLGIGLRSLDPKEQATIRDKKLKVHTREGLNLDDVKKSIRELRENVDVVMVSFDIDVADMTVASATEMQNSDGLSLDQIYRVAASLGEAAAGLASVIAVDVAELYPRHGKADETERTIDMVKGFLARVFGIFNIEYGHHMEREVKAGDGGDGHGSEKTHELPDLINQVLANQIFRDWDDENRGVKVAPPQLASKPNWFKKGSVLSTIAGALVGLGFFLGRESEVSPDTQQQGVTRVAPLDINSAEAINLPVTWGQSADPNLKDPRAIGWSDSFLTGTWDYRHQEQASDQFKHLKNLVDAELTSHHKSLTEFFEKERDGFYHPTLGRATDSDHYQRNSTISYVMSAVTLALLRTSPEHRTQLLEQTVGGVFAGDEGAKIKFMDELNKFTLNVESKDKLMKSLETMRFLPERT